MNKQVENFMPDRSRFDNGAANWNRNDGRHERGNAVAAAYGKIIDECGHAPDLFDYGCGTGLSILPVAAKCASVTGCDFSPAMLEQFSESARQAGLSNVQTMRLDLTSEPGPKEQFDMLTTSMTLHHVGDIPAILAAFRDMLRPGGTMALTDLETEDGTFHSDNTGVAHFGFDKAVLADQMREVGLTDVNVSTIYTMKKQVQGVERGFPIFLATGRKP